MKGVGWGSLVQPECQGNFFPPKKPPKGGRGEESRAENQSRGQDGGGGRQTRVTLVRWGGGVEPGEIPAIH